MDHKKKTDGDDDSLRDRSGSVQSSSTSSGESPKLRQRVGGSWITINIFVKMGILLAFFMCVMIFNLHQHPTNQEDMLNNVQGSNKGLARMKRGKKVETSNTSPMSLIDASASHIATAAALRLENEKLKREITRLRGLVKEESNAAGMTGGVYFCPIITKEIAKSGINPLKDKAASSFFKPGLVTERFDMCNLNTSNVEFLTNAVVDSFEEFSGKICDLMATKSIPYGDIHLSIRDNPIDCCYGGTSAGADDESTYEHFSSYYSIIFALEHYDVLEDGHWVEFGVNHGFSINVTSIIRERTLKNRVNESDKNYLIHGFGASATSSKASTDVKDSYRTYRKDIRLHDDRKDTLVDYLKNLHGDSKISWININDGLFYDETLDVLNHFGPMLRSNSILLFRQPMMASLGRKKCLPRQEMKALYTFMQQGASKNLRLQIAQFVNPLFPWSVIFKVI